MGRMVVFAVFWSLYVSRVRNQPDTKATDLRIEPPERNIRNEFAAAFLEFGFMAARDSQAHIASRRDAMM